MPKKFTYLDKKIIQIYILLIPFTSAFALGPWLPLPLLFMMIVSIYVLFSFQLKIFKEDWEILFVIIFGIVGFVFSTPYLGAKNINHTAAILNSILFFYIIPKNLLIKFKSIKTLGSFIAISLAIVSIFVAFEFIGSNYLGINFLNFIPYTRTDLGDATVAATFIRPRGFTEEAGHMAVFYELALPLSFLYFKDKGFFVQLCYYIPVLATFIVLFSSTAFITLPLAFIVTSLLTPRSKSSFVLLVVISAILIFILSSDLTQPYVEETVGSRLNTFLNPAEESNFSAMDRSNRYKEGLNLFFSAPFGIGWGMSAQLAYEQQSFGGVILTNPGGLISLYLEILVASGIQGLLLFIKFLGKKIVRLVRLRSFESQLVLVSVLSISLHYVFIANYWFPMLWFSLALADTVTKAENKHNAGIAKV